jgi:hypothetical protein
MLIDDRLRGRWQSIFCCHERTFKKNDVIVLFHKQRIQRLLYLLKSITFELRRSSPQNPKYLFQSLLWPRDLPEGDFYESLNFQPLGGVRFALLMAGFR